MNIYSNLQQRHDVNKGTYRPELDIQAKYYWVYHLVLENITNEALSSEMLMNANSASCESIEATII